MSNSVRYKKYGADQIERFNKVLQEEGLSLPKAAVVCDIPCSSVYRMLDEFKSGVYAPILKQCSKSLAVMHKPHRHNIKSKSWRKIFNTGKAKGLFKSCTLVNPLKSSYYHAIRRTKKQR
ncbi:hypothetical protein CU098_008128 [Rhizopus stolonifer]|uniref:Uncharacterized protein n=1 Tax=Rhizopus stolonifer TaxID=4846 RepID=A0A367KIF2_RHIST|nr:hypothetical protein CU098_008128 [Rhizopus stolonifer]